VLLVLGLKRVQEAWWASACVLLSHMSGDLIAPDHLVNSSATATIGAVMFPGYLRTRSALVVQQ
jgi:hypothetical protein